MGFILRATVLLAVVTSAVVFAQQPPAPASMRQLMLDLIHPASNAILLSINRGGPASDAEWAAARHSGLTLQESGNVLMMPGRARDQGEWMKDARALTDAGAAAYKAAQAKDAKALALVADKIDASCTNCHKQYRPNVFPRGEGGSK